MSADASIAQLGALFAQTLDINARKEAEAQLDQATAEPGFCLALAQLVSLPDQPPSVRLAAAIKLKNTCRQGWTEVEGDHTTRALIFEADKQALKAQLLPLLVTLSSSTSNTPPSIKIQLSETLAVCAEREGDLMTRWPTLIRSLVDHITIPADRSPDPGVLVSVLQTSHSIFKKWRSAVRSDSLYTEINWVLANFAPPYLTLLSRVDAALADPATPSETVAQLSTPFVLLLQLFHDLCVQDLPPIFEDNIESASTVLLRWLSFSRPEMTTSDDEGSLPGAIDKARAAICEVADLYATKYGDAFPQLPQYVQAVWEMLGRLPISEKYDVLVSKAIRFLSAVVRMPANRSMFESEGDATLRQFISAIVLPNISLREADEEMFEDNPIEYIRRDLETGVEADTRRTAASSFTKALMEQFETVVTSIISEYITQYLQASATDPANNWKQKDTAIYLLTSIAARTTTARGVSSVNKLVDVVKFFEDNVFSDLKPDASDVNPILQVDAIKFLNTFRNQLTKEQILSVLPLLVIHLESQNYVTCSYAAITIERVLYLKTAQNVSTFSPEDLRPFAEKILMALFRKIQSGDTPEKIAENDYLMKCVMRVITISRQTIVPVHAAVLQHLTLVLAEISKNPSNPHFSQYCFESIAALIRFVTAADLSALTAIEQQLLPPLTTILQQDIAEFVPFVFQILSQMLELHSDALPATYHSLLPPLLTPQLWESRGNIPPLVRLLQAFLQRGASSIAANSQLAPIFGIYQRLIQSRVNDSYGFELIQSLFERVPAQHLEPFCKSALICMLTRLQTGKTEKFSKGFVYFVSFLCSLQQVGYPDLVVDLFDSVQPGLFSQLLQGVVVPDLVKVPQRQRRVVSIGMTRLLTQSRKLLSPPNPAVWAPSFTALLKLHLEGEQLQRASQTAAAADEIFLEDWEDQGFQASYARLAASEAPPRDPVAWAGADAREYLARQLASASSAQPGIVSGHQSVAGIVGDTLTPQILDYLQFPPLLQAVDPIVLQPFMGYIAELGLSVS